jgi:hypothetical protein
MQWLTRITLVVSMMVVAPSAVVPWASAQSNSPASAPRREQIVEPKRGAVLTGSTVHVVLAAYGIELAPASAHRPGTAHHHVLLDHRGLCALKNGESEVTFDSLAPGQHRLIAELADPDHNSLKPPVADTVLFTVKSSNATVK